MKRVCCADYYEKPEYFGRFKSVGDVDDDTPERPAPNPLDIFVGPDSFVPSVKHSAFLRPGDVPYDVPPVLIPPLPHHPLGSPLPPPPSEAALHSPLFRARCLASCLTSGSRPALWTTTLMCVWQRASVPARQ